MRFALRAVAGLILLPMLLAGCKQSGKGTEGASSAAAVAAGELKTFPVRGRIVSVDAANGMVMLDHEAIPGFMDAMTMPYKLKDASIAQRAASGRPYYRRSAGLARSGCSTIRARPHRCGGAGANRIISPASRTIPRAGRCGARLQAAQPGRAANSSRPVQGQGTGADLCLHALSVARLTASACDAQLCRDRPCAQADPALYANTHLLSISFDAEHDTPAGSRAMARRISERRETGVRALGLCRAAYRRTGRADAVFRCGDYAGRCGPAHPLNVDRTDRQGRHGARLVSHQ